MEDSSVVKIRPQGRVVEVILSRPERLNAIDFEMKEGIDIALKKIEDSDGWRVVVLRGEGRAFCSGGDLGAIRDKKNIGRPEDLYYSQSLLKRLLNLEQVVIAAVHGFATGAGCNLAMAADLVYAAEGTQFGQAFVKVGLTPDWGGFYLLPRLVGVRRAKECFLFGERFDAQKALSWGLVNGVFPSEQFLPEVMARASKIATGPWNAIRLIKEIVDQVDPFGIQAAFEAEVEAFRKCSQSPDFADGLEAFFEKREPNFQ